MGSWLLKTYYSLYPCYHKTGSLIVRLLKDTAGRCRTDKSGKEHISQFPAHCTAHCELKGTEVVHFVK